MIIIWHVKKHLHTSTHRFNIDNKSKITSFRWMQEYQYNCIWKQKNTNQDMVVHIKQHQRTDIITYKYTIKYNNNAYQYYNAHQHTILQVNMHNAHTTPLQ